MCHFSQEDFPKKDLIIASYFEGFVFHPSLTSSFPNKPAYNEIDSEKNNSPLG